MAGLKLDVSCMLTSLIFFPLSPLKVQHLTISYLSFLLLLLLSATLGNFGVFHLELFDIDKIYHFDISIYVKI